MALWNWPKNTSCSFDSHVGFTDLGQGTIFQSWLMCGWCCLFVTPERYLNLSSAPSARHLPRLHHVSTHLINSVSEILTSMSANHSSDILLLDMSTVSLPKTKWMLGCVPGDKSPRLWQANTIRTVLCLRRTLGWLERIFSKSLGLSKCRLQYDSSVVDSTREC